MGMHNLAIYSSPISEKSIGEFIYRPSGPVEGNFYDDWSKLVADLNADVHSRKTIYFDESYNSVLIPSGTWALEDDVEFRNFGPSNEYATVQFDDGCIISGVRRFTGIYIASNSTGPIFTFGSASIPVEHVHLERAIVTSPLSPAFQVEDNCTVLFYLEYSSKFQGNPVVSIGDFGFVEFRLFSWSSIEQSTISSAFATSSFAVARDASSNFILPQNGISHSDILIDDANKVNYLDNSLTGPLLNANNVQDAIDALKYHPKAVADLPALEALPIVWPIQHGYQIWVSSLKTFYRYSSTALTVDNIVYVTSASTGTWVRELEYHDKYWIDNQYWYLDPVNGDDRLGTATVKTFAEIMRRSGGKYSSILIINISGTSNVTESLKNHTIEYVGPDSGFQSYGVCYIVGSQNTLSSGTITASTQTNMLTGNTATVLDYSGSLSAGSCVKITSGPQANYGYFNVVACPTGGYFATDPTNVGGTVPNVGDTYSEIELTTVDGVPLGRSPRTYIVGVYLNITDVPNGSFFERYNFCKIQNSTLGFALATSATRTVYDGSFFQNAFYPAGNCYFRGCGFGAELKVGGDTGRLYTQACVHAAPITIGITGSTLAGFFVTAIFVSPFIWDPGASFAIKVTNGCNVFVVSALGGSTSNYGVVAQGGGQAYIGAAITMSISTPNPLWLGFSNLQLPELLSSATGSLPSASSMTNYSQLFSPPFNGYCVSYQDGSKMAIL